MAGPNGFAKVVKLNNFNVLIGKFRRLTASLLNPSLFKFFVLSVNSRMWMSGIVTFGANAC